MSLFVKGHITAKILYSENEYFCKFYGKNMTEFLVI